MPIRVTCPSCHARFNVSDRFAGKEGPCPKCKTQIKIPATDEEVVIHAPEEGPKDSQGRQILKPIIRSETKLTSVQITLIAVSIVGFLLGALILRMLMGDDASQFPIWLLAIAAIIIAPPVVYAAYTFLRDQELGTFVGRELWNRVLICSAIYALLWIAMPVGEYAFGRYELGAWILALVPMLAIGATTGMYCFDFDYMMGLVHYGMYAGICLAGRWLAGVGALPGALQPGPPSTLTPTTTTTAMIQWLQPMLDSFMALVGG